MSNSLRIHRRVGIALTLSLIFSSSTLASTSITSASSASSKPTPKAKKKSEVTKKKQKSVKKPTKKKSKKPRKISKPLPSPSPKWPPKGFKKAGNVFISTPISEKELVGVLSANSTLLSKIRTCEKKVCAVVYVASSSKCEWWEVQSIVIGRYADVLGNIKTLAKGSKAKAVKTIILISQEPVEEYAEILNMKAFCRNDKIVGKIPSNIFTPNPELTPTPAPSPSPSSSPSPTVSASASPAISTPAS